MCGIAGIFNFDGQPVPRSSIERLTDALAHRGPDGRGVWLDNQQGVALGHRRLAILDLSEAGHQPMPFLSGRYWITYNGEVYNFLELRRELEGHGLQFHSQSDTEVILAAYHFWGPDALLRFNGMWAFAIYDRQEHLLFASRDRFGIKPFYYTSSPTRFAFASELKAFCRLDDFRAEIDAETAAVFLQTGVGVEGSERTIFRGVRRLRAGSWLLVRDGRLTMRRWWNTLDHLVPVPARLTEQAEEYGRLFYDSVKLRMRSDVPIGTCLSGGFDSTSVVCALAELGKRHTADPRAARDWQRTFIATFPGSQNDERPQAEEVVQYTGVSARFLEITDRDALVDLDQILSDFDDVSCALPTACWLIYRELRRDKVVVSLDGHGADEEMGGYKTPDFTLFFDAPSLLRAPLQNVARLKEHWRTCGSSAGWLNHAGVTANALLHNHPSFQSLRTGARMILNRDRKNPNGLLRRVIGCTDGFSLAGAEDVLPSDWGQVNRSLYEMFHSTILPGILRNFDRLSMAHGIEIRMPFMDWRLVCFLFSLPECSKIAAGQTKRVAREAFRTRMPETIRSSRTKVGFNSPVPEWLSGPLRQWAHDLAHSERCQQHQSIDGAAFPRFIDETTRRGHWSWRNCGTAWQYLHLLWFEENFIRMNSRPHSLSSELSLPALANGI